MALLRCHVLDSTGRTHRRWLISKRGQDPAAACRQQNLVLLGTLPWFRSGFGLEQTQALYHELGCMLKANVPLTEALHLLGQQPDTMGSLCRRWRDATASGQSLSQCMAGCEETAHPMALTMTRVGENSGQLGESLHFCAQYFAKMLHLRQKLISSLLYPALVVVVSIAALVILTFYVLPRFTHLFIRFDLELPFITRALLGATAFFSKFGWLFLAIGLILIVWGRRSKWHRHERVYALRNRLPIVGPIISEARWSVFCEALGILLKADVRIHEALGLLNNLFTDPNMNVRLGQTHQLVLNGRSLAEAFATTGILPDVDRKQLAIGESSGTLTEQVSHLAIRHQALLEKRAAHLLTLFEPMMILGISLFIGLVLIGLYLPLFELLGGAGIRR